MQKLGFDSEKYNALQSQSIKDRISRFGGKLYLEFGGKLFDDYHASRVFPGFQPDSKVKMLLEMKDDLEIVLAISADDIERSKRRGDLGITYDEDTLRLIDSFRGIGLYVGSVVITHYRGQKAADKFHSRLNALGIKAYRHYIIPEYPSNVPLIISEDGFGRNDYIETTRPLVVVTAPGPGSGKMATCLSQLYHEHKRGINYNRDVEIFPVLEAMFREIYGESPYKSPTDMGVNQIGFCILDEDVCCKASRQEIIRRYYASACSVLQGLSDPAELRKIDLIMNSAGISVSERKVVDAALSRAEETGGPAVAIELNDGRVITGKTTDLLGAASACLINAMKAISGIRKKTKLIPKNIIEPIQHLKVEHLGNRNPLLHTDEILIALSVCAVTNPLVSEAIDALGELRGCEAHSSVILSHQDQDLFKRLGVNITFEPRYQTEKLFHS